MEELTREEAIRRHRLMWNWIADEAERTHKPVTKMDAFKHFGWSRSEALSSCWCCEWVCENWKLDSDKFDFVSDCSSCPLDWSNGEKKILKATCSKIMSNEGHINAGLFEQWYFGTNRGKDPIEAARIARIIGNLPEKKEVKEND